MQNIKPETIPSKFDNDDEVMESALEIVDNTEYYLN